MNLEQINPSTDEKTHSNRLKAIIADEIRGSDGFISFRRYMEMALYQPGFGYYVSGTQKFGKHGDFVTAPEISPIFSICLARQCREVLSMTSEGCILEIGAGSGVMAIDILLELEKLSSLPQRYYILELSPDLRQRQEALLRERANHLVGTVQWLDSLEKLSFSGAIIANECLDAMPVECFSVSNRGIFQRGVCEKGDKLIWCEQIPDQAYSDRVDSLIPPEINTTVNSEFNPVLDSWLEELNQCLTKGAMILIDYGYKGSEYYHVQRTEGTLICHYKHTIIDNPFYFPGLVDISASVDFSAVARAAEKTDLMINGYTTQAHFLFANDLEQIFESNLTASTVEMVKLAGQIKKLTLPAEMGERFQVIGLTKGVDSTLRGFTQGNISHKL